MKKFLKITMPILLVAFVLLSSCDIFSMFAKKGTVTGIVYSSASGQPEIEGVRVTADGSSTSATTNSDGEFTIELPAGTRTLHFAKSGYQFADVTVEVVADETTEVGEDIVGYPVLGANQYRIVLTWGENPRDLDSHLILPSGEDVYYSHKLASDSSANLDWDDTSSYGPETITIDTLNSGNYYYSVKHFSGSGTLGTSGAVVKVYKSSGLWKTYTVSSAPGAGTSTKLWWQVFKLSSNGTITAINQLADTAK